METVSGRYEKAVRGGKEMNRLYTDYLKSIVLARILPGRERAIKCGDLAFSCGIKPREVRQVVQNLRDDGYPICSTTSAGYWLATSPVELDRTIKALRCQADTLEGTIDALVECKKKINGRSFRR